MWQVVAFIVTSIMGGFLLAVPTRAEQSNLQQKIFPLECNVDLLHTGVNELQQIDPEDCLPKPPQPPGDSPIITPPSERPDPLFPSSPFFPPLDAIGLNDNLPPAIGFDSVQLVDVRTGQEAPQLLGLGIGVTLLLLAIYLIVTNALSLTALPLIWHRFKTWRKTVFKKRP